jgi:hypothetical protein
VLDLAPRERGHPWIRIRFGYSARDLELFVEDHRRVSLG